MRFQVCIVTALPQEAKIVKHMLNGLTFPSLKIEVVIVGVGGYQSLIQLQEYLSMHRVDFLLSLGVCGKKSSTIPNKVIQVWKIFSLARQKEWLCPLYLSHEPLSAIAHSERVLDHPDALGDYQFVDMESASVSLLGLYFKIPYSILKSPVDVVSPDSKKVTLEALETAMMQFNLGDYGNQIEAFLSCTPVRFKREITELSEFFRLTHTQTLQLEYYFHSQIAFENHKENIFLKLRSLDRTQLIELLKH